MTSRGSISILARQDMETKKSTRKKKILNKRQIALELVIFLVSLATIVVAGILVWVSSLKMPDFQTIESMELESTTKIYDRTGKVLLYAFRENIRRTEVPLSEISPNITKATLAIEDADFYKHGGISLRAILRSIYINVVTDKTVGGSTLTQQVVKNALLTQDKTIERKVKEIILAVKLEQTLTKDQILSMYLNNNPYGGEIYGVEEASLYYFATSSKSLDIAQSAYLAAIPKNPPLYNPYGKNFDKLEERKNLVLDRMLITGQVTQEEYDLAKTEKVVFIKKEDNASKAHHFVFFIKDYLAKKYGDDFDTKGLSVITTLDADIQKDVEDMSKKYIASYIKRNQTRSGPDLSKLNTAFVVLDAKTGQILAMVGSRDYNDATIDGNFNVATALRQPGSSIKPIVYAAAFEDGLDPETIVFDTPTEFNPSCPPADGTRRDPPCYSPQNYDGSFFGALTIREALGNSRNVPAVKLLYLVGVQEAAIFAKKLGITSLTNAPRYGLSLVLGGAEVSLLELSNAYLTFSQNGTYRKHTGILNVKDKKGKVLEEYKDNGYQVISEEVAAKISSILTDNNARARTFGYNSQLYFGGRDVAAKTGTTNNVKDGWVIGYTDKLVVGGWIGKNDNTTFGDVNASLSIVPLWNQVFNKLLQKYPAGQLNKDYSGIPELDGIKCTTDGAAMDVIYTVMQAGLFTHITPNDPQIKNWFYQSASPYCGVAPALDPNATGTPTTGVIGEGVTVTTPEMSVPQPITPQTGTGLQPGVPQN